MEALLDEDMEHRLREVTLKTRDRTKALEEEMDARIKDVRMNMEAEKQVLQASMEVELEFCRNRWTPDDRQTLPRLRQRWRHSRRSYNAYRRVCDMDIMYCETVLVRDVLSLNRQR